MPVSFVKDTGGTLNTGLVGYWKLNDTADSLGLRTLRQWGDRLYDTANTNPCTFHPGGKGLGYATFRKTSGTIWQGLLNDVNSPTPVGNNPVSVKTNDFSFAAWVRVPISETVGSFFHNGNRSATSAENLTGWEVGYGLGFGGAGLFSCTFLERTQKFADTAINTGEWVFVAFSFSSTQDFIIYINGSAVGTADFTGAAAMRAPNLASTSGGTEFGNTSLYSAAYAFQYPATCDMQECGVWDKVLTSTEISDLYNGGNGQKPVPSVLISSQKPSGIKKVYIKTGSEKWQTLGGIRNGELKVTPEKSNNTLQNNLVPGSYLFEAKFELLQTSVAELEKIDSIIDGTNSFLFQLTDAESIPVSSAATAGWATVLNTQIGVKAKYVSETDPSQNQYVEILIQGSILTSEIEATLKAAIVDTDFHLSSTANESFSNNNSTVGGTLFGYYVSTTAGDDCGVSANTKPNGFATVQLKDSDATDYFSLGRVDSGKIIIDWIAEEDSQRRFIVFNTDCFISYELLATDSETIKSIGQLQESETDVKITLFDGKVFTFESKLGIDIPFENLGDFDKLRRLRFRHTGNILTTAFDGVIS